MVFIDLIAREKDQNAILIKGWGYNETNKRPLKIEVESTQKIDEIQEKDEFREDVLEFYDLDNEYNYGFILKIYLNELKGKLRLIFKDPKSDEKIETVKLNLDKKYCHPKERNPRKEALKQNIKEFKNFITTGNGVRYFLNKFKKVLPGEDPVYKEWILANEPDLNEEEVKKILDSLDYKPLISILVPVYNVELVWLKKMVDSVLNQYYPNWQLCIADDCSTKEGLHEYLEELAESSPKIDVIFREENGRISEATNSAFKLAKGEFIGLLDNDDTLAPNALLENVIYLNQYPDTDMIYSDEDKIDEKDFRKDPYFKSDFAPDTILSNNYICHFLLFRRSLFKDEILMRKQFDGAQDYDLILRIIDKTDKIGHIPKILYHWRAISTSTAQSAANKEYIIEAGKNAIQEALNRRNLKGEVVPTKHGGFYEVIYEPIGNKKVSIIVPTKNNPSDIKTCVNSIIEKTEYDNYEIVVVDNGSDKPEALEAFDLLERKYPERVKIFRLPIPFNYSRINNRAAEFATGDFYLFLNDDTEVITKGWLKKMLGYAQQPWIGCVGAKLYYPDNTIQHAGVVMGILGIAGHVFSHYPSNLAGYFGRLIMNTNYTAVTAACLMIERDKFWQVGGFDEDIAVSFNDVDLCCKVAEAGYYNIFLSGVELYHYESKSRGYETTSQKMLRFEKECARIVKKWRKYIKNDPMYNPNLTLLRGDYSINN